jgi:CCR4-NOT transcriptional regulation complex NOT5 subunit
VTDHFKKNSLVTIRFLPNEKEKLKQLAAEQKKNLSELIREIALQETDRLNTKIVPEINRRLYFKLGQVSKKLQTLEISSEALNEFQELLNKVRRELVGLNS